MPGAASRGGAGDAHGRGERSCGGRIGGCDRSVIGHLLQLDGAAGTLRHAEAAPLAVLLEDGVVGLILPGSFTTAMSGQNTKQLSHSMQVPQVMQRPASARRHLGRERPGVVSA